MSAKRAAAYSGAALLLLAWFSSAGGLMRQAVVPAPEPVERNETNALAAEVQSQTQRLRNRMAAAPAPQEPFRNPFAFASRAPEPRSAAPSVPDAPAALEAPPLEPAIELIGVAESASAKGVVRTAIVSALGGELFLVKEGDALAARYRVTAVAADAVELADLLTGTVRRLALRE